MVEDPRVPAHEAKIGYKSSMFRDVHILIDVCLLRQMRNTCYYVNKFPMHHWNENALSAVGLCNRFDSRHAASK
jgi:hypothetical protein